MIRLVAPHTRYRESYLAASDEFARTGEQRDGDGLWAEEPEADYTGFTFTRGGLEDPDEFARFVAHRHATEALRRAIPLGAARGIPRLLLTCREDNTASRAVIEANGGVYEDSRNGTRRYWVGTGA